MSKWQPIETAPKDGSRVIVYGKPYGHFYDRENQRWGYGPVGAEWVGEAYWSAQSWQRKDGTFSDPTHWMPLPSPPEARP